MSKKTKKAVDNPVVESSKKQQKRVDVWLVERGLAETRAKAQALIMAGAVLAGTRRIDKAGETLDETTAATLTLKGGAALPYVSRGGLKLERALDFFQIDPTGKLALDVGASTGGFTDCLLQRGARRVIALDVGHSQLAWSLRQDARVFVLDKTNVRYTEELPEVEPGQGAAKAEIVAIDVSFISLKLVLPAVRKLIKPDAPIISLIKPQFEAGKAEVGKGGIIRDPQVHSNVLQDLVKWCYGNGFEVLGLTRSPILGTEGNAEFLAHLQASHSEEDTSRLEAALELIPPLVKIE